MSFGLSLSDLKLAWQVVSFLHEKCFTKAFRADVQYRRFGEDVELFAENLEKLIAIAIHANKQRPKRPWRGHEEDYSQALQPLSLAVGDFQSTLKDCETLLEDQNRFRRDEAGFIDNVIWHRGTQRDVDILRGRIHFHSTKLQLILKPFELHLLLEIYQELRELKRDVAEIRGLLVDAISADGQSGNARSTPSVALCPEIPLEVQDRFLHSAQTSGSTPMRSRSSMPLSEGFDGLVYHFARSTVEFKPRIDQSHKIPDELQMVNLWKSQWIMEHLEESIYLQEQGETSLWASYLDEIRTDIIREHRRFQTNQLVAPLVDNILLLPDEPFSVWAVAAPPIRPPDLAEKHHLEDRILELTLPESTGSRKVILSVFRRSAIEVRLVTTTTDVNNPGYHQEKDYIVNTDAMKVIPAYAAPNAVAGSHNLLLSSSHVQDQRWQYLSCLDDVHALQQALLGYRVHHSMPNVSWSIDGSTKSSKIGTGRLQFWQLQALQSPEEQEAEAVSSNGDPSINSPTRSATSPKSSRPSTLFTSSSTLFSGTSATTTVTGSRGNGTAVIMPEPPVMILFTKINGANAFLHVQLDINTSVNPDLCDCRRSKKPCRTVVIDNKKEKHLSIRKVLSSQDAGRGLINWDLALFRMPRHPKFRDVEIIPKAKYLRLDFASFEEKDLYLEELSSLEKFRTLELKTYYSILNEKKERGHRPTNPSRVDLHDEGRDSGFRSPQLGGSKRSSGRSSVTSGFFMRTSPSGSYASSNLGSR